jgi:hypothetical protein
VEQDIAALERTRRAYLAQLRVLVERQLAELNATDAQPSAPGAAAQDASAD